MKTDGTWDDVGCNKKKNKNKNKMGATRAPPLTALLLSVKDFPLVSLFFDKCLCMECA